MLSSSPQNQPLVSVVIPCYNAQQWVSEAIESCLNQTYSALEIIVVDDGSTDNSLEVLREFQARYPQRIQVLTQAQSGAPVARNHGFKLSKGSYLQFLDADDVILPRKIESQMQRVEVEIQNSQTPPDLVVGNYKMVHRNGDEKEIRAQADNCWAALINLQLGYTSANLWRREMLLQIGAWDESVKSGQDYELLFRVLKAGARVVFAPDFLTLFRRINDQSIMTQDPHGSLDRAMADRRKISAHLQESGFLDAQLKDALHQSYFRIIRGQYFVEPQKALRWHRELIPRDFIPEASTASRLYQNAYRVLGLRNAERVMKLRFLAARLLRR